MLHMQSIKQNRLNYFFMLQLIAPTPVHIHFSKKNSKYNVPSECQRIVKIFMPETEY
jgi:hypothetical protein